MDGIKMVSIRFSDIFSYYVREYGVSDLSCGKRCRKFTRSNQVVLDIPCSVGMDIFRKHIPGLGGTVQFRVLQPDAYIAFNRSYCYDFLQTENMVCFLPDGNDDAGNLQIKKQEIQ